MIRCDVAIVGGGPAGSTCARRLAQAGLDVVVVDRARFPRDKCCAGWITPQVVDALGLDLHEYARGQTLQPITGFVTGALGHPLVETRYRATVSYAIRRCEFDHYLLERSGARLELGVPVDDLRRERDRWIVANSIEARWLVGAGGHFCPVAKLLNPGRDAGPVVAAQEVEFRLTEAQAARCEVDGHEPQLFFCPDRRGYGWCVRKGEFLNVGFGRVGDRALASRVREFVHDLIARGRIPPETPRSWPGHAYRLYALPQREIVGDGVLLVGDAAGLAHPVSGEGILTAVESGCLAAQTIVAANLDPVAASLEAYRAAIRSRYGEPAGEGNHSGWRSTLASRIGVRLMRSHWFTRRVLLDRWFLHRHVASLAT